MPGNKSFHRTDRVAAQLRREIGQLVHAAVREHGLPSMSVSDVEVTRDLAHAKVFVTVLQAERAAEGVKALRELAREIRFQLGRMLRMRSIPELHFHHDDSMDRGQRIDALLRDVAAGESDAAVSDDDADAGDADPSAR
ncbi:30S ribosome-binding factor RbfA [Coralloluteibacterium thermophilus]|uniref:Ribosome-binding factor A n=1 Tax=Coralloluteibacterium thermophilum TaxID=2707049 RepID=A0ABV9NI08_9GAMM